MRRGATMLTMVSLLALAGCQQQAQHSDGTWFAGSLDQAKAAAQERGTMLLLDFYSDT